MPPAPPVSGLSLDETTAREPKRILVVEDSKIVAAFMHDTLEENGDFLVSSAYSLAQVHEFLAQDQKLDEQQRFFAAVLDLHLPDAPSGEVVDVVLQQGLPGVVLTSFIDKELRERIEAKGVVDYVLKSPDAARQVREILLRLVRNKGVRILVVDDSQLQRRVTSDYLQRFGFHVLEAANGKQALTLLRQEKHVPLVITDYEMPEMDGFELCTSIRKFADKNQVAVIGVSGRDAGLLCVKLLKAGANDFLTKPFEREELYTRIMHTLETQDYIRQINNSLQTISGMHERMKKDLEAAAQLQQSLLPDELPQIPGIETARLFVPCDELAGDTFNIFRLDNRRLGLYVLDVSGHGVQAALLSVTLSRLLAPEVGHANYLLAIDGQGDVAIHDPADVCTRLNREFPMDPDTLQYFTITYGILDCATGEFRYACAGHPGPILLRKGQKPVAHGSLNMAIGFVPEMAYKEASLELQPGDRLYFYTDGLVEAKNGEAIEFGTERLCEHLQKQRISGLEDSLQNVYNSVRKWTNGMFNDDVTLCALEFVGHDCSLG